VAVQTIQAERRVWVHDLRVPGSLDAITAPETGAADPLWTRDGQRLVYSAYLDGRPTLFSRAADAAALAEMMISSETALHPLTWTRDDRLLYISESRATNMDIWELSRRGGAPKGREVIAGPAVDKMAQVSPSGEWLAYVSNEESGFPRVYVRRFPSLADRRVVSTGAATSRCGAATAASSFSSGGKGKTGSSSRTRCSPTGAWRASGARCFALRS
jgi:Tol biopolymer transport system component